MTSSWPTKQTKSMITNQIKSYYDATTCSAIRSDLTRAIELINGPKIAIDCGCGAGANIEHLATLGFTVYGYDLEDESISRCKERFKNNKNVILSQDSFSTFNYPKASLILADASLFFCPKNEFDDVWHKIYESLFAGGIFCGSFLGPFDTMANPSYSKESFWPNSLVFREQEVKSIFENYEICSFTEHKLSGKTAQGVPHDWHIFSVVARKNILTPNRYPI